MDTNLSGILPLLRESTAFKKLTTRLSQAITRDRLSVNRVSAEVKPYLLAALQAATERPLVIVTTRPTQARELAHQLSLFSAQPHLVSIWSSSNTLPYERIAIDTSVTAERLSVLSLCNTASAEDINRLVIVGSVRGLMQPTISPADYRSGLLSLKVGQRLLLDEFLEQLTTQGYRSVSLVEEPGQFNRRGGIVDLYPLTAPQPVRLELFDDEIESLRYFDPTNQRSTERIQLINLTPPMEAPLHHSPAALQAFRRLDTSKLRPEVAEEWQRIMQRIEQGLPFEGIEQFLPYYNEGEQGFSLLDHLPDNALFILDEPDQLQAIAEELAARAEELREEFINAGEAPPNLLRPYLNYSELIERGSRFPALLMSYSPPEDTAAPLDLPAFEAAPDFVGQTIRTVEEVRSRLQRGTRVIIVSQQMERLREQFEDAEVYPILRKDSNANQLLNLPPEGTFHLLKGGLAGGFVSSSLKLWVLSDREIYGWTKQMQQGTDKAEGVRRSTQQRQAFLRDLKPGEYVVHIEHGIARYEGLVKLKVDSSSDLEREFLFLRYAEQDKLYVPIDQVDRILPYTSPGVAIPQLHRLGSGDWQRVKRKTRSAVEDISRELLDLYSKRAALKGHSFAPDSVWQREMEEAFPFTETPDQMRTIIEVKQDMEQPRPMDRLVCGDVGYGKTEVAVRAAFKAVNDGHQVAILVPTTVLASQHYETFRRRLEPFEVVVEQLSRFKNRKEQLDIVKRASEGKIDILIGTHRLLNKDVIFKNLGLIVVDEEQRFGVKHKERLKQIREEVDVLAMSATPIPRTLYMSLTGIRDISIIETPPVERVPVKTYVTAFNDRLVREAIVREIERGGQVFYVHNRVQGIVETANALQKLIPQARILVGHGQMEDGMLENVMLTFTNQQADVLVCTTIIESGLDIPNANTLIVDNAIMYGLAQLYQLRGRVGRSSTRGYAYFLYKPGSNMTVEAQQRLETILETQELGAGFKIAMKDMEIRGAGNLLGAEQSGNISAVGFELYMRMLEEAVERQKGEVERPLEALLDAPTVNLILPLPAYLPESYIADEAVRLDIYRKLAAPVQKESQIRDLVKELEDRFGELPGAVRNLMYLLNIKVLAIRAGVVSVVEQEGEIYIRWAAPSVETEMRRQANTRPPERKRTAGSANVDARRLMREFGEALRIAPNLMRLNTNLLKNDWQERLRDLLEELAS